MHVTDRVMSVQPIGRRLGLRWRDLTCS